MMEEGYVGVDVVYLSGWILQVEICANCSIINTMYKIYRKCPTSVIIENGHIFVELCLAMRYLIIYDIYFVATCHHLLFYNLQHHVWFLGGSNNSHWFKLAVTRRYIYASTMLDL